MNLNKLNDLDQKQNSKLESLRSEYDKIKATCDAKRESLPQVLIEKGEEDADIIAAELNKMSMLLEAREIAIHQLETKGNIYYSDEDVVAGFKDYAKDFNNRFEKLHSSLIKCYDEAFLVYKKLVDLRRSCLQTKEDYKYHLLNKSLIDNITLETLDVKNRSSKDSVANFISYYGDPFTLDALNSSGQDLNVF